MPSPAHPHGFSLFELLFVLIIATTLVCLGLPALGDALARTQLSSGVNQWMTTLAHARGNAVSRSNNVVVCPAAGGNCVVSSHWHRGWIMFEDRNRNAEYDPDESLLLQGGHDDNLRVVSSSGRQRVRYRPDGTAEGTNLTLTLCGRRGVAYARTIVLNNAGRARSGRATPEQAAAACAAPSYHGGP